MAADSFNSIKESIRKHGTLVRGKRELLAYLDGKRLTAKQTILAKCFECMGFFADGRADCGMPDCPCYAFMPFRAGCKLPSTRISSEKQRKAGRDLALKSKLWRLDKATIMKKQSIGQNKG